ncbi:MAG: sugar transferase [Candidatus Jacksonbacteria bacterium]|nr:sugar transferase [Candidatus Jacksonbacteria bacterium]
MFTASLTRVDMEAIAGFPFISIRRTPLQGWGKERKRVMDIAVSAFAIILCFIPACVIAICVKITSKGPIFVRLTRVGEGGKQFTLYKFRSMVRDAEKLKPELMEKNERKGPLFKMKDDPRVTGFGRFLRRWSLDELPNFYNVLTGIMSLVGPRPHEPEEVIKYRPEQRKLLNIKPGITGFAQISGRSSLDFNEEARLDLYYVQNWNIKMDIAILLKTPFAVLFRKEGAV